MTDFDFSAPADIFASPRMGMSKSAIKYHRFGSAAEAIRFVMETLPAQMLGGTVMEVGNDRFTGAEIRRLYDDEAFPLPRARVS